MRMLSILIVVLLSAVPAGSQAPLPAPVAPSQLPGARPQVPVARPQVPVASAGVQRAAPAATSGPLAPDHVAGLVLSATDKHPVVHATVTLRESRDRRPQATTRADAEGHYSFGPQPVGKYNLAASAPGYLTNSYLEHEGFSTAIVLGAGLKTEALTLELVPNARIAGRVLDASGEPVERAALTLYRETLSPAAEPASDAPTTAPRIARFRNVQTADDGGFEFTGVAPGSFYLSVTATPWYAVHPRVDNENGYVPYRVAINPALDVAYPEVFYPHARSAEEASPFIVKAGDRISADMVLQPEHALSVTFRLPPAEPGQAPNYRIPQLTRSVFGVQEQVLVQNTGGFGQQITLSGISPGHYALESRSSNGRSVANVGALDLVSDSVTMDLPADTEQSTATVNVTVHAAAGESLPTGLQLLARRPGNLRGVDAVQQVKDGAAAFTNLAAGDYRLTAYTQGPTFPVLALTQDGKPVPDRRLHIGGSQPIKADLTVSLYSPSIVGFARHDNQGTPGVMVVLVPASADTSTNLFRRDQSDLDGSFTLRNVVPGHYLLVAIDDAWTLRWNDPAALLPYLLHALPVNVPAAGAASIRLSEPAVTQSR